MSFSSPLQLRFYLFEKYTRYFMWSPALNLVVRINPLDQDIWSTRLNGRLYANGRTRSGGGISLVAPLATVLESFFVLGADFWDFWSQYTMHLVTVANSWERAHYKWTIPTHVRCKFSTIRNPVSESKSGASYFEFILVPTEHQRWLAGIDALYTETWTRNPQAG